MKKGFTFVELLLVMLVLGIIISLTLPIIKNIKDDDDIYRAYMKKANQDVTDAINMISIKENLFRGFEMLKKAYEPGDPNYNNIRRNLSYYIDANANDTRCNTMRNLFNAGLNTFECGTCHNAADTSRCYKPSNNAASPCISNWKDAGTLNTDLSEQPGLILGGKPAMIFLYNYNDGTGCDPDNMTCGTNNDPIYGYVFVDVNKDKSPNECCKDRYKFIVYNDRVAMETTGGVDNCGCTFEMGN